LNPRYAEARVVFAIALAQAGDLAASRAEADSADALAPTLPAPASSLARLYATLGDFDRALRAVERALAAEPSPPSELGELREALLAARRGRAAPPGPSAAPRGSQEK